MRKVLHSYNPAKKQDPSGGLSYHTADLSELRHAAADGVVETRGEFPIYRPGDIWRMLQGAVFQR